VSGPFQRAALWDCGEHRRSGLAMGVDAPESLRSGPELQCLQQSKSAGARKGITPRDGAPCVRTVSARSALGLRRASPLWIRERRCVFTPRPLRGGPELCVAQQSQSLWRNGSGQKIPGPKREWLQAGSRGSLSSDSAVQHERNSSGIFGRGVSHRNGVVQPAARRTKDSVAALSCRVLGARRRTCVRICASV
jgi:hypothetical protein